MGQLLFIFRYGTLQTIEFSQFSPKKKKRKKKKTLNKYVSNYV